LDRGGLKVGRRREEWKRRGRRIERERVGKKRDGLERHHSKSQLADQRKFTHSTSQILKTLLHPPNMTIELGQSQPVEEKNMLL